jgi:Ca-activated chloride channel family protein
MLIFTYPWALTLLAVLPLLAWRQTRQSNGALEVPDRRIYPPPRGGRLWWARRGGPLLRFAGLALAIVALAGPRWPDPASRIPTEGISIAMVVDVSASMGEEDFVAGTGSITRLAGVKHLFRLFVAGGEAPDQVELPGRPHDLIALVTFATYPDTACPLTLDHAALLNILEKQETRSGENEGTTNPGDAIVWALHVLQQAPTKRKVIVFLTDGDSNVATENSPQKKPRQAAQLAANLAIPIYAIDASPEPGKDAPASAIKESLDARTMMQTIAGMTEGHYFRAQDSAGLVRAYESIDRLERDRILSFQYRRYYEGFFWFALAALACWLSVVLLEATWWRKLP